MSKIFIDCTSIAATDLNTGIQRVERNLIQAMLEAGTRAGVDVTPVYCYDGRHFTRPAHVDFASMLGDAGYLYTLRFRIRQFRRFRKLLLTALPFPSFHAWLDRHWKGWEKWAWTPLLMLLVSPLVMASLAYAALFRPPGYWQVGAGDLFFVPGSSWWDFPGVQDFLPRVKDSGGRVAVLIHDLFPVTCPQFVDQGNIERFATALPDLLRHADLLIANSASTQAEVADYLARHPALGRPRLAHAHLGVDAHALAAGPGVRSALTVLFEQHSSVYLCVGTIEPRKNHAYLLDAFEHYWRQGGGAALCLVGKYGWLADAFVARLRGHAEWGRRLFWFDDLNDRELAHCYRHARALLFPSRAEGFGLPLVEALREGCPVMASDIPVFREIGGAHCAYFPLDAPEALARLALEFDRTGVLPGVSSAPFEWPGWRQAAENYLAVLTQPAAAETQPR